MQITAKFSSTCPACGGQIDVGATVEWAKGRRATHVTCPVRAASTLADRGTPRRGNNRRPGTCEKCGQRLAIGEGHTYRCLGEASGCMKHYDEDGGWHTDCADTVACKARAEVAREAYRVAKQVAANHGARVRGLFDLAQKTGEYPTSETGFVLVGEEIPLDGSRSRIYGGGRWAVIEPEGERVAPEPAEVESVRAEHDRRVEALRTADAALIAWTTEHLPVDSPTRKMNGGRAPYDGRIFDPRDLACLALADLPIYKALEAEICRLGYTDSPDSYHALRAQLADLEQQVLLATYPRSIWLVANNGGDGDCWGNNNVRTGGAGGIGWRLPWTADLEAQVRAAREPGEEDPDLTVARSSVHAEDAAREV